jgi:3-isopropylmalate/(R)-2-methylmalate dehydratase large subunit
VAVDGRLPAGVTAKDLILSVIAELGIDGGNGAVFEYRGEAVAALDMEERMTVCNMSIEGAARVGYVNPDDTTFRYIEGRPFAPQGAAFAKAREWWKSLASDADAVYDDVVLMDAAAIEPTVTWGINPGQSVGITEKLPAASDVRADERASVAEALEFMSFRGGMPIAGTKIDVAFIGSCTNGRISDLREAARLVKGHHVAKHVKALVVPGSQSVRKIAEEEGLDKIFTAAGFEWRGAGCSMCLAMNPDQLQGREICASSSNRNFKGRQGSPTGRTLLMSPAMVAAAAVAGEVVDVRKMLEPAEVHA